jgi:hypothetical protein
LLAAQGAAPLLFTRINGIRQVKDSPLRAFYTPGEKQAQKWGRGKYFL